MTVEEWRRGRRYRYREVPPYLNSGEVDDPVFFVRRLVGQMPREWEILRHNVVSCRGVPAGWCHVSWSYYRRLLRA